MRHATLNINIMATQINKLIALLASAAIFSCQSERNGKASLTHDTKAVFEFLDSVVVTSLAELYISDKDPQTNRLLLNDWEMNELIVTDLKGEVISRFEPRGEGPHQVQSPLELGFWKEGFLVKEISAGQHFHFFNSEFEKIIKSPALADGITLISMPNSGKSFSQVTKDGKSLLVGYEHNALAPQLWAPEAQHPSLYEKAETGYIYEPASGNLARFNLYPETWRPRAEQKWAGMAYPQIQVAGSDQVVAILPNFGNQLFYYTLNDSSIQPLAEIKLRHPERDEKIRFDVEKDDSILYPFFSRLMGGGDYFLVEFTTAFPRDLYESFRAKGENFNADPEYREALEKFYQSKYILTDTQGNQAAISELPVPGVVSFLDADDIIYIKPTLETELDYNVFYRYRVSLD